MKMLLRIVFLFCAYCNFGVADIKDKSNVCESNFKQNTPCITINKLTPNTSQISKKGIKKIIITHREISDLGAVDIKDVLESIPGINITQSGPKGQQSSLFTRGTNSNHTLALLNGIPINDQSTTQGAFDFGVDFIQNIQQIEVYSGANGAHFGPNAIGGAINIITDIDYKNNIKVSGYNNQNNSINFNYTVINDEDWILNLKGGSVNTKTDSSINGGKEKDGSKNVNLNFNAEKWLDNINKLKFTAYGRNTLTDYDNTSSLENDYSSNNLFYVTQLGLDRYNGNILDSLIFHYHKYDRENDEQGTIDEFISNSSTLKGERKIKFTDQFSYGLGFDHKYNWGEFENRGSYRASTKGHIYNTGIFTNIGFDFLNDTILSFYARSDEHKLTGTNNSYKINLNKIFDKLKLSATHSTGLRNPSLYELYGTDNFGYSGNLNLNPEKSETNELNAEFALYKNFLLSITGFKSNIFDQVEYKNNKYVNHSSATDLNQSGIETSTSWMGKNFKLTFFGTSLSSKKIDGSDQLRRPDKTYGIKYKQKIFNNLIGPFEFNLKYHHYGKHWDTHSSNYSTILMDSTNIVDLSLTKKLNSYNFNLNLNNIFNEIYQRPHGYMQPNRKIFLGFNKNY